MFRTTSLETLKKLIDNQPLLSRLFSHFKKTQILPGIVALSFTDTTSTAVSMSVRPGEKPRTHAITYESTTDELTQQNLKNWIDEHALSNTRCTWVLGKEDYKLLLIDALKVEPNEMTAAAKWRIKDLINFPLEQAVIQVFPLPNLTKERHREKMYVVAAKQPILEKKIELLKDVGLHPIAIDIPELSLQNVATLYNSEQRMMAMLTLDQERCYMTITSKDMLCFTRPIKFSFEEFNKTNGDPEKTQHMNDRLLLEIQRTYDYCQSELKLPTPEQLLLDPIFSKNNACVEYLSKQLPSTLRIIHLTELLQFEGSITPEQQNQWLNAIGAALRFESETPSPKGALHAAH